MKEIPRYGLDKFKNVHRQDATGSRFGYNTLPASLVIPGFEMYSSEGLAGTVGPLKSEFYRVSITLRGTLDMQIGLDPYPHRPGTLAFTFPDQIFSKGNFSGDVFGYYILFNPGFLNDIIPSVKIAEVFPFYDIAGMPVFQISDEALANVIRIVMHLNNELQQSQTGREQAVKMYLYLLLLEAKRSYEQQGIGHETARLPEGSQLARRFRMLVARHYPDKRQVADYARMLGISPNHLNKTVKDHTGLTASAAIREMLLQEAKSLLRYTDNSVAEIAYRLDFSEPASFNRFFRSRTGLTPLSFRQIKD